MYSHGTGGEAFRNINLWDGFIRGLTVVCTLLIVIALWLVTKSCAVACFVEMDRDTTVGDSGSETDSFGASDFGNREYSLIVVLSIASIKVACPLIGKEIIIVRIA